jgi:ornithine carbamoyltransferase
MRHLLTGVYQKAENRLHVQKAILEWSMGVIDFD